MGSFYLYRHVRTDLNQPFYIGIGKKRSNRTDEYFRANQKSQRSKHWLAIFNKCNSKIDVEILLEDDSHEFINEKEKEFISIYGRSDLGNGVLVNHTNGGDGVIGHKFSEETRKKMSESHKGNKVNLGRKASDETKKKLSLSRKGRVSNRKGCKITNEQKEKLRLSLIGRKHSQETKDKIGSNWLGRKHTEESKKLISLANKGKRTGHRHSEATKNKISLSHKGKVLSGYTKNKISIAQQKRHHGNA